MPNPNFHSLLAQRFGRLRVIARAANTHYGHVCWLCMCDCGTSIVVRASTLRRKKGRKSCGCLQQEIVRISHTKHDMSKTDEYRIYHNMIARCQNPKHVKFKNYGGRGITVHWTSFEQFYADMGPRPSKKHSVERRDNNGPYSHENCYWATSEEQMSNMRRNKHVQYEGQAMTLSQAARKSHLSQGGIIYRLANNIGLEEPRRQNRKFLFQGQGMTINEIADITGFSRAGIVSRLKRGIPFDSPRMQTGPKKRG